VARRAAGQFGERLLRNGKFAFETPDAVEAECDGMVLTVILDLVAARDDFAHELRILCRAFADAEEARFRVARIEKVEHTRRDLGIGAVVEGQRDFIARGGRRRQPRDVRAEQCAARPKTRGGSAGVIGRDRAQHPRPRGGRGNECRRGVAEARRAPWLSYFCFAHEWRRVTARLKTGAPGSESTRSATKYPCRSNWKRSSGCASINPGSR